MKGYNRILRAAIYHYISCGVSINSDWLARALSKTEMNTSEYECEQVMPWLALYYTLNSSGPKRISNYGAT